MYEVNGIMAYNGARNNIEYKYFKVLEKLNIKADFSAVISNGEKKTILKEHINNIVNMCNDNPTEFENLQNVEYAKTTFGLRANYSFFKKQENPYAIIEVDEANVKFITEHLTPEIITVTNLFRDQLDRYGEVYTTLVKILEGITKVPESKLVLNGDESLLGKLDVKNPVVYYGFNTPIKENASLDLNADAKF